MAFRGFFASEQVHRLLGNSQAEMKTLLGETIEELRPAVNVSRSSELNYIELKRYLHDQLLRDTDVFSMAHSIEVRVPLLDHTIVEYVSSLRPELKLVLEQDENAAGANVLNAFSNEVRAQSGKHVTSVCADVLLADSDSLVRQLTQ